jgi:Fe-S cluster assembly protein SufB
MKYPAVVLKGENSHGEVLSIALAGKEQCQDTGAKMIHLGSNSTSRIISKSISHSGGRTSYRGLVAVSSNAKNVKNEVNCDALILDNISKTDTYPTMRINNNSALISHEASVSKIREDQLFYLCSRGIPKEQASSMIVSGFIEPIVKELPMEYAVELNRLIELQMENSVG